MALKIRGLGVSVWLENQHGQCIQENHYIHWLSAGWSGAGLESFYRLAGNVTVRAFVRAVEYGPSGAIWLNMDRFCSYVHLAFTVSALTNFGRSDPHALAVQQ
jgi:hypothetical protein